MRHSSDNLPGMAIRSAESSSGGVIDREMNMKFNRRLLATLVVMTMGGTVIMSPIQAGCPCQKGGGSIAGGPQAPVPEFFANPVSPPLMPPGINPAMLNPYPTAVPPSGMPAPPKSGPGYSAATATSWQPPPGTIGQTYQMKSRPVPVKMHPRAAIVDVHIPNATNVRVHDMNVYRTQDFLEGFQDDQDPNVWHFTSEPLVPKIPHIYRIEARLIGENGEEKMEERYVRLIMGRVIDVSF